MARLAQNILSGMIVLTLLFASNGFAVSMTKADVTQGTAAGLALSDGGNVNGDPAPAPANEPGGQCEGETETWLRLVRSPRTEAPVFIRFCKRSINLSSILWNDQPVLLEGTTDCRQTHLRPLSFREFFATTMCMRT